MDLRETEKQIWEMIWIELVPTEGHDLLIDTIRNHFSDLGWLKTDAKVKRFEEAVQRVRDKIRKNWPKKTLKKFGR